MRRLLLLAVTLLAVYSVGQYSMNHWTSWDAATKASAWVAFGTLALAVVTVISVYETRAVLRGEDRRMQQRFAPYLTTRFNTAPSEESADDYDITGFLITNSGYGIARDILVHVKALAARYDDRKPLAERIKTAEPYLAEPWILEAAYDVISEKATVNATTSHSTYSNRGYKTPDFETALVTEARITYLDTFGNQYETIYDDWDRRESRWIQPANLRLS